MRAFGLALLGACAIAVIFAALIHRVSYRALGESEHAPRIALLMPSSVPVTPVPPLSTPAPRYLSEPSAIDVASNPFHFVGAHVRWTCRIDLVPSPVFADAVCEPPASRPIQPYVSGEQMEHDPAALAHSIEVSSHELRHTIFLLSQRGDIVLTGPVSALVRGNILLIHGTVRRPLLGENAFGVQRPYPTVHIDAVIASQ